MTRAIVCARCTQPQHACHCAPVRYAVVNLRTQERGVFVSAHECAVFLWGRDLVPFRVNGRTVAGERVADIERGLRG